MNVRRVAILGSTGSIGRAALEVIASHPGRFRAVALAAQRNLGLICEQIRNFSPAAVGIADPALRAQLPSGATAYVGEEGIAQLVTREDVDVVLAAISGAAGLPAVLAATKAGKTVALANKESMVVAGSILVEEARRSGATILPVDSEHSAVFQAMRAGKRSEIRRVILTASGGPFRDWSVEKIRDATPADALAHPTWQMGRKITIDSATMFNKALEIIEAVWLFDLPPEKISVVIHPQSVVHSMVEFVDGNTIAQLSPPDMRTPIQYALSYPDRFEASGRTIDWTARHELQFIPPDLQRFPALRLGYEAASRRGTSGAVLNAANEAAVEAFFAGKIGFTRIAELVEDTMKAHAFVANPDLQELMAADRWAREYVNKSL